MRRLIRAGTVLTITLLSLCAAASQKVDRVVVLKGEHRLLLLNGDKVVKAYAVAIGGGGLSPKVQRGDRRTPEGLYEIDRRNKESSYHLALHISYPNEFDRERARKLGVNPGGDIMIHGITNGQGWVGAQHRLNDWTDGCIAVTDQEIEEIWSLVSDGTPVEIRP
jgi:murein L,D-transpeptidase YafK